MLGTVGAISGEVMLDDVHVVELARQSLRGFDFSIMRERV